VAVNAEVDGVSAAVAQEFEEEHEADDIVVVRSSALRDALPTTVDATNLSCRARIEVFCDLRVSVA
jgi:hypothetical protein